MALSKRQVTFWRREMEVLDDLYKQRMKQWQNLVDLHNLEFDQQIRDLDVSEMIRVPVFYTVCRQLIAAIAFNYPKLFVTVEDDEGEGFPISDILERASSAFLRLANVKPHVHQAIFDALPCGIGWLRVDYNPPGDDLIPPYVANDSMAEDLVCVSRVPPGFVHVDPQCPPHMIGHARYIRERMWVPLKQLKDDDNISHRREIKATSVNDKDDLVFGEPQRERSETDEQKAVRESVDNGDFVLVDRIHDRMNRRQIMFADGVEEPIQDIEHPFAKMHFDQRVDILGAPMFAEDGETPVLDLENGQPAAGWLVEHGLPFIPLKFDMSVNSYYPVPQLELIKDLQGAIVESMSRQSAMLKRSARQALVRESEAQANPELVDRLRKGNDGEFHVVQDPDSAMREIGWGSVPGEQYALQDRAQQLVDMVTQVNDLSQGGAEDARTATEAGLIAAAASINREWMESAVATAYETVVRNAFQIMGDPRYTPEDFTVNVAPDGAQRLTRALQTADFLWNYRINVQAGSTRPLFEQLQRSQAVDFYDRARNSPNFDAMELDKFLASAYEIADPEKLLVDDMNEEANRAVQLEHDFMFTRLQDPGVFEGQDHQAHMQGHQMYQELPQYQQLLVSAQARDLAGNYLNPQAVQQVQLIDQLVQGHIQGHQQALQQEQENIGAPSAAPSGPAQTTLQGQVQSNAQNISNQVAADTAETIDAA